MSEQDKKSEYYDGAIAENADRSHHTGKWWGGRFTNPWKDTWEDRHLGHGLKLLYTAIREKRTLKPKLVHHRNPTREQIEKIFPLLPVEQQAIQNPPVDGVQATWLGHSTFLVQMEGLNFLTDPIFEETCSPLPSVIPARVVKPALTATSTDLPTIDAVVISHNHYDHLCEKSVLQLYKRFGDNLTWFVPLGLKAWFKNRKIKSVVEMDWMEEHTFKSEKATISLVFTPAQHWSMRSIFNRNDSLWGGWAIVSPKSKFWFAGDTGYSTVFKSIGDKLGPFDLSAIPIGAYSPRWFMKPQHINPEEAVVVHKEVSSRYSVAMHFATFLLTDEALDEPVRRLKAAIKQLGMREDEFVAIKHGGTISVTKEGIQNGNLPIIETME